MNLYKEYIYQLTKLSIKEPYIILVHNVVPTIKGYVRKLESLKYKEEVPHKYYGDIKKLVSSFLTYFSWIIDDVMQEVDKCTNVMDKDELLKLLEESISTHIENQIAFGKEFLPVKTPEEKEIYQQMEENFKIFTDKANAMREYIEKFEKQERVDVFAKQHFPLTIKMTSELFNYTHFYLSMMLLERSNDIRVSVEEIHLRLKSNLKKLREEVEDVKKQIVIELYNKNKENLSILRREKWCPVQYAEVTHTIKRLRNKIKSFKSEDVKVRLKKEVKYWEKRVNEFHEILNNFKKIKEELEVVKKEEETYNSLTNVDVAPGSKHLCWRIMGKNLIERREHLKQMKLTECKTLFTYFAVRGCDNVYYKDDIGTYYLDQFKHQVYASDYGQAHHHVNCEGQFVDPPDRAYYFDKNGRYVMEDKKKIHQIGVCTSEYNVGADNLLHKITKDCGHSDKHNINCRMESTDSNNYAILPDAAPIDIKNSLSPETVKYIWDTFGHILPDALYDVCAKQPQNPIHFLAHRLLYHKYNTTAKQLGEKFKNAQAYRENIYKERKEKDIAAAKAWKAEQWKRPKPEHADDYLDKVYAQQGQQDFIDLFVARNQ